MEVDRIYQEDCLETLGRMEDNSVDLIITSPPYNKGWWSYNKSERPREYSDFCTKARVINYGDCEDRWTPEEYEAWQRKVITECLRVLKPTGSLFYNHTEIQCRLLSINPTYVYDFPLKQTIVWDKGSTPRIDKSYFFPCTDWLYWIKKTEDAKPYFNRKEALFRRNVWTFAPDRRNSHPAPFPLALPENCILTCTKEGDVVYDPFMGSGTTAVAAKKHNRHYIGSELNTEYVAQAEKRLRDYKGKDR